VTDYLHPDIPAGTRIHDVPLVRATRQSMKGFGEIVRDPRTHKVEIVQWPAKGWRKLDDNTGDEGGTTEGVFACAWQGNELIGHNEAVGGHYVLGFRAPPEMVRPGVALADDRVLLWHCNYHPDGGQFFWSVDGKPFVVPAAPPGDDVKPEDFVAFWSDGSVGIYLHPDIWHEARSRPSRPAASSTSRARCMRASPAIWRVSSACSWACRCPRRRDG
jgi:hypothetical protein